MISYLKIKAGIWLFLRIQVFGRPLGTQFLSMLTGMLRNQITLKMKT